MRLIIFAIGILLLTNVVILAVVSSTHHGHTIQAALSVATLLYAAFYCKIPRNVHIAAGAACAIPVIFAAFLMIYGNIDHADYGEDVVIVLGAGLQDGQVGAHLAARLDTALDYLRRNPQALVIVCGGLGASQPVTEAEAMARYLIERGVPPENILLEDRSTTTYENLIFAGEILENRFPDGFRAALITNDFHIFRASVLAQENGIDASPRGAPTPWHSWTVNYLREILAIVNMWVFG
jgi:uncharacterized SAM-binding protein YcdF (DUF218 family)